MMLDNNLHEVDQVLGARMGMVRAEGYAQNKGQDKCRIGFLWLL